MKKYRVTVNGTVYEVELEELTGSAPVSAPAAPAAAPAPAAPAAPAAGEQICAPMPGNILAVNVTASAPSWPFPGAPHPVPVPDSAPPGNTASS